MHTGQIHMLTFFVSWHIRTQTVISLSPEMLNVVVSDIPPVLKPGRLWKKQVYPDHTFDQSRNNAVMPVSHLFLETRITTPPPLSEGCFSVPNTSASIHVTRTGKAVKIVNYLFTRLKQLFEYLRIFSFNESQRVDRIL